jgi:nucleotide-binding universal stress UspA family protein
LVVRSLLEIVVEATMLRTISRILVPTDFSEPSEAALDYARTLARQFGATFHLLHVIELPSTTGLFSSERYVPEDPRFVSERMAQAKLRLARRLLPSDKARYRATKGILVGPAGNTIVKYAQEENFDLIVMGTHGRSGLTHVLMGSVAEHVVRTAPCPVLTVHSTSIDRIPIEERAPAAATP